MTTLSREETDALIAEVLEVYPEKAQKDRKKHLAVNDQTIEQSKKCITSNRKSLPGVMTIRGCAYAGSKGVVWGPIKDMIHISHGPVGCGQYSRAGRRNYYVGTTGVDSFGTMNFTSDFQEKDIVFGGDKKLAKLIEEVHLVHLQRSHTLRQTLDKRGTQFVTEGNRFIGVSHAWHGGQSRHAANREQELPAQRIHE